MLGATLLFGINYWVAKGLMPGYLKPLQIIFLRISGALILIWLLELITPAANKAKIQRKDLLRVAIAALLGISLNQILFFTGLNQTTPVDSAIINSTNPLMVILLSYLFLKQPIKITKVLGIILGAFGALLLILNSSSYSFGNSGQIGNIYIVANTLSWSLYLVIVKPLTTKYHPYLLMRWVFLFGFFFALPTTLKPFLDINTSNFTLYTWFSIAYVIIGTTFLAYLFITFGLRRLSPPVVAFYTYIQPVIVAIIGILLFREVISLAKILAALLIFSGIYLVNKGPSNRKE